MKSPVTFRTILDLARLEQFAEIAELPGAGTTGGVMRVVSRWRAALSFIERLSAEDLRHFAKGIAVFEDTIGGIGSVTLLQHVMHRIDEPDNATLNWITSNTRSYWYYSREVR